MSDPTTYDLNKPMNPLSDKLKVHGDRRDPFKPKRNQIVTVKIDRMTAPAKIWAVQLARGRPARASGHRGG